MAKKRRSEPFRVWGSGKSPLLGSNAGRGKSLLEETAHAKMERISKS